MSEKIFLTKKQIDIMKRILKKIKLGELKNPDGLSVEEIETMIEEAESFHNKQVNS